MRTNGSRARDGIGVMQRTKTWVLLYALGIALLVFSLCRSEEVKPAPLSQRGANVTLSPLAGHPSP